MASVVALTPAQAYSREEWEKKRPVITQLYRDDAKSLDLVRVVLAQQYAFRPTAAMLKKRIKAWDIGRNHNEADMLYALRIAFEREAGGKKTTFLVRGRLVTFQEVKHYFKRKGVLDLNSLRTNAATAVSTTRIDCRTPSPGDSSEGKAIQDCDFLRGTTDADLEDLLSTNFDTTILAIPRTNQVPMSSVTGRLCPLEQVLHLNRNYYDGVFENPTWRTKQSTFGLVSLMLFYCGMLRGELLLKTGCVAEAFTHFEGVFREVYTILNQQHFWLLPHLYLLNIDSSELPTRTVEIRSHLMRYISMMAGFCSPQLGPFKDSLSLFQRLPVEDRGNASRRALRSIMDHIIHHLQEDTPKKLEYQVDMLALLYSTFALDINEFKLGLIALLGICRGLQVERKTFHRILNLE